jgi:hypothetical protein
LITAQHISCRSRWYGGTQSLPEFALVPELPKDDQTLLHRVFSPSPIHQTRPCVLLISAKLGNGRTALFGVLYLSVITEICGYGTGTARCAMRLRGSDTSYGPRSDDLAYLASPTFTLPDTHLPSVPLVLLLYCFIIQLLALAACLGCLNACRFR